jgi:RNA-binding protein
MITKEIKNKARNLAVMLRVGKNGLNEGMIDEIRIQLKKKKLLKIKMLKSSYGERSPGEVISELTKKTKSELVSHVGNVVVIYKKS